MHLYYLKIISFSTETYIKHSLMRVIVKIDSKSQMEETKYEWKSKMV